MTGPQHYTAAEQLLSHAAAMLDADAGPERATELVQRQIAVATLGQAHALAGGCGRGGAQCQHGTARRPGMAGCCGRAARVTISLRCPLTWGNMAVWPIVTALRAAGAWKSSSGPDAG